MNIFFLDRDPKVCAKYHADLHVTKMCLEYSQILQTAMSEHGYATQYQQTHKDHPIVRWTGESIEHWNWLHDLALVLNEEYKFRYEKEQDHRAIGALATSIEGVQEFPGLYPHRGWTDPPQSCIPAELRQPDVVEAYRAYYREVKQKEMELRYTKRNKPEFLQ